MILDLRRLDQAPAEVEGSVPADDPVWESAGVRLVTPLWVKGTAEGSSTRGVWFRAALTTRIETQCRRCLESLEVDVADELAVFLDPEASTVDEDVTLYAIEPEAVELDLRPILRERVILAVSDYPLCGADCRGLCPSCGVNLNETDCDCEMAEPDTRWGALLRLQRED